MARPFKHNTKSVKIGILIEEYVYERLKGEDLSILINELLKQYVIVQDADQLERDRSRIPTTPYQKQKLAEINSRRNKRGLPPLDKLPSN